MDVGKRYIEKEWGRVVRNFSDEVGRKLAVSITEREKVNWCFDDVTVAHPELVSICKITARINRCCSIC